MAEQNFRNWLCEALTSLPQDVKAILRLAEDPDLSDESRELASGSIIHLLCGSNAIPGTQGVMSLADDVLMFRIALVRIMKNDAEAMSAHVEAEPELLGKLDEHLEIMQAFLGDCMRVLENVVDGLHKLSHQGRKPKECVHDADGANWLYGAVQEAMVEQLDLDDENIERECRDVGRIKAPLESRLATL